MKQIIPLVFGLCIMIAGCKKASDDLDTTFVETKLTDGGYQKWSVPFTLSDDVCPSATANYAILTLHSDHTFEYLRSTCSSLSGTWNLICEVNHTGQKIRIDFYATSGHYDGIDLKYSSDSDTFYTLDDGTLGLKAFEKYTP